MPKIAQGQTVGVKKNVGDGAEYYKISKPNRKLPPLASNIPETSKSGKPLSVDKERLVKNSSEDDTPTVMDAAISNKQDNKPTKMSNKRRSVTKQSAGGINSASSSVTKRVSAKPKRADIEVMEPQSKTKPRKKVSVKVKPPDKQQEPSGNEISLVTDHHSKDGSWSNNSTNSPAATQWTNIVKRVHIHKLQKTKSKSTRKKDYLKRKRSEYVIENTWLPRDKPRDSPLGQKTKKRQRNINNKGTKDSRREAQSSEISKSFQPELDETGHENTTNMPVLSANVTFDKVAALDEPSEHPHYNRYIEGESHSYLPTY